MIYDCRTVIDLLKQTIGSSKYNNWQVLHDEVKNSHIIQ
jgi:hypothetical protein